MTLLEPTTTLTDFALAVLAGYLGLGLLRLGSERGQRSVSLWGGSMLALAQIRADAFIRRNRCFLVGEKFLPHRHQVPLFRLR